MDVVAPDPGAWPDREGQVFLARLRARRARVTVATLALLGAVFVLELQLGATGSSAVLGRMGAMLRSRLLAGEWWRLMSSGVLHGSVAHFALNGYVLWVLGRDSERLLGSARFLVLYVVSALVAALASALVLGQLSVGASGAIWGLLGAQAVLAFGPRGYVPEVARPAMQKAAASNLALNVVVSFLPHVDWVAHFAGGAAGAGLVASGLLLRGLPRLSEPEPVLAERGWRRLAALLGALYLGGATLGLVLGRPWELGRPLAFVERELGAFAATVRVPTWVGEATLEVSAGHSIYTFGDELGPILIGVQRQVLEPRLLAAGAARELARLCEEASRLPDDQPVTVAPHTVEHDGRRVTVARSRLPSGLVYDLATTVEAGCLYRVEVLVWSEFAEACEQLAPAVASSLRPTAGALGPR